MPDAAQGRSYGGVRASAWRDLSPVLYPPLYDITKYLRDYRAYFDTMCPSNLPFTGAALVVSFGTVVHETTAGT